MNKLRIKNKNVKNAIKFPASIQLNRCLSYKKIHW